jgi:hypothetical protein
MYVMDRLWSPRFSFDKRMPSVEYREERETSENDQLNVARHAFSCSMRSGPI